MVWISTYQTQSIQYPTHISSVPHLPTISAARRGLLVLPLLLLLLPGWWCWSSYRHIVDTNASGWCCCSGRCSPSSFNLTVGSLLTPSPCRKPLNGDFMPSSRRQYLIKSRVIMPLYQLQEFKMKPLLKPHGPLALCCYHLWGKSTQSAELRCISIYSLAGLPEADKLML